MYSREPPRLPLVSEPCIFAICVLQSTQLQPLVLSTVQQASLVLVAIVVQVSTVAGDTSSPGLMSLRCASLPSSLSNRGLSLALAKQVAAEYTEKDVIRAHARDELGIDMDAMSNPVQVGG